MRAIEISGMLTKDKICEKEFKNICQKSTICPAFSYMPTDELIEKHKKTIFYGSQPARIARIRAYAEGLASFLLQYWDEDKPDEVHELYFQTTGTKRIDEFEGPITLVPNCTMKLIAENKEMHLPTVSDFNFQFLVLVDESIN